MRARTTFPELHFGRCKNSDDHPKKI
jgi:hypothetical protein